ncbi:MAG: basic secretory protein-like protein [Planctomycetota bacterium]
MSSNSTAGCVAPIRWLVEGIADYIRWFLYEPETRGAEVNRRNISRARYDSSYRISGNFLNWVTQTYDKNIVRKLNAAARQGKYNEELWKEATGRTVQELGDEWKKSLEKKIAAEVDATAKNNTLTGK